VGVGVRWTMEWRVMEGVVRIRGMWKTLADKLGDVSIRYTVYASSSLLQALSLAVRKIMESRRKRNVPIAYDTHIDLLVCHRDYSTVFAQLGKGKLYRR
jgi:hypothetical protein